MNSPDYNPLIAAYVLISKRILAASKVLHSSLQSQDPVASLLAVLDLLAAQDVLARASANLAMMCVDVFPDGDDLDLEDWYNDLLMQASGNDPMVLMGEAFDEQVALISNYLSD
jgi:hypothetical protein